MKHLFTIVFLLSSLVGARAQQVYGGLSLQLLDRSNSQNWMRLRAAQPEMEFVDTLSRWSVGVETGGTFSVSCGYCTHYTASSNLTAQVLPFALRTDYRIWRWLSLGLELRHLNISSETSQGNNNYASLAWPITDVANEVRTFSGSVSASLMLRVWQGDLSLGFRIGRVVRMAEQHIVHSGHAATVAYQANFAQERGARLSYTYWPHNRLGISAALESLIHRGTPPFVLNAPKDEVLSLWPTPLSPDTLLSSGDAFARRSSGPWARGFMLGIHYRL